MKNAVTLLYVQLLMANVKGGGERSLKRSGSSCSSVFKDTAGSKLSASVVTVELSTASFVEGKA